MTEPESPCSVRGWQESAQTGVNSDVCTWHTACALLDGGGGILCASPQRISFRHPAPWLLILHASVGEAAVQAVVPHAAEAAVAAEAARRAANANTNLPRDAVVYSGLPPVDYAAVQPPK